MRDENIEPRDLGLGRLFGSIRDAVIVADAGTGRIVLWNPAASEVFGHPPSDALGMSVEALIPSHLRAQHREGLARYRMSGHGRYVDSRTLLDLPAVRKDDAGDRLLVAVARRLRGCLRNEDTLARFGGDEFVVLVDDATTGGVAPQLAERLLECLAP